MRLLERSDPVAVALVEAIQVGGLPAVRALLEADEALATAQVRDANGTVRTTLHLALVTWLRERGAR